MKEVIGSVREPNTLEGKIDELIDALGKSLAPRDERNDECEKVSFAGAGSYYKSSRGRRRGGQTPRKRLECRICSSTDHLFRQCPSRFCQSCGKKGHDGWAKDCPNYKRLYEPDDEEVTEIERRRPEKTRGTENITTNGGGPVTLSLEINSRRIRGMIDSGASRSIMDIGTLESLGLQNEIILDPNIGLTDASNNKMAISGRCTLRLYIPEIRKTFRHEFSNVKTYKTLLLGRDFLSDIGPVTIDVQENRVKIDNRWIYGEKSKNRLRVNICADIVLPGRTEQTICVYQKLSRRGDVATWRRGGSQN